ncbi:ERF family protein [Myroides odoratus]|uniref:ERF family protein n=1 Tax=Myroides odoratus TaxID=256 RepID=UPI00333EF0A0
MKELLKALFEVKKSIGKMTKDSNNPFFKSKYFDINQLLEHVEPLCQEQGLLILQPIKDNKVITEILHIESGEKITSEIELPNLQDPQKIGSAITYYRRYTLGSLLSIQADDDDGNKAAKPKNQQNNQTSPTPPNEPTKWLNVLDKDKNYTKEWKRLMDNKSQGKVIEVKELRKFYKISKEIEAKINELFNS